MTLRETLLKASVGGVGGAGIAGGLALAAGLPPAGVAMAGGSITALALALSRGNESRVKKIGNIVTKGKEVERYSRKGTSTTKIPVFLKRGEGEIEAPDPGDLSSARPLPAGFAMARQKYAGKGEQRTCPWLREEVSFPNTCYQIHGERNGVCQYLKRYSEPGGRGWRHRCAYPGAELVPHPDRDDPDQAAEESSVPGLYAPGQRVQSFKRMAPGARGGLRLSQRPGRPLRRRAASRSGLTGVERQNLLNLVYDYGFSDTESVKQELADHIDSNLTYAENKTALQEYLRGTGRTEKAILRDYDEESEQERARQHEREVQDRYANAGEHIEQLRACAERGDVVAREELDLFLQELTQRANDGHGKRGAGP